MFYIFFLLFFLKNFPRVILLNKFPTKNKSAKIENKIYIDKEKKNLSSNVLKKKINLDNQNFLEKSIYIKENFSLALRILRLEFEKIYEKKINEYRNKRNLKIDEIYNFFEFTEFANFFIKKKQIKIFKKEKEGLFFFEKINESIEKKISENIFKEKEKYLEIIIPEEKNKNFILIKNLKNLFVVELNKKIEKSDLKNLEENTAFKEIYLKNDDYFLDLYFCHFLSDILSNNKNSKIYKEILKFLKKTILNDFFYIEDPYSNEEKKELISKYLLKSIFDTNKYFKYIMEKFFPADLKNFLNIELNEFKKSKKSNLKSLTEKAFTAGFLGISSYLLYKGLSNNFSLAPMDIAKKYYNENLNFKKLKELIFDKGIPLVIPQVDSTIKYVEKFLIKNDSFKNILISNPASRFIYSHGRNTLLFSASNVLFKYINKFSGNRFNFFENYPPTVMGFFIDPFIRSSIRKFSNNKKLKVFLKKDEIYKNIIIINELYSLIDHLTENLYKRENFDLENKYNKVKGFINTANIGLSLAESLFLNKN